MAIEIFLLALASTVRPTSMAAVSALLSRDARRRLLLAYVAGGLAFTIFFGLVVVLVFHGIHLNAGSGSTKAVADIVGGVLAVLFGFAVLAGVVGRREPRPPRAGRENWMARWDRRLTVRVAALVGPLTHLPGIFYLIALNVIVASNPSLPGGVIAVGAYNAIWFAVPIAALVLCLVDPDRARIVVLAVGAWTKEHSRTILIVASFVVGVALIVRGIVAL